MALEIVERNGIKYRKTITGGLLRMKPPIQDINPLWANYPEHAGVYLITCLVTGKKYVGSSINLRKRLSGYFKERTQKEGILKHLQLDKINIVVLQDDDTLNKNQVRRLEREWIDKLDTAQPNGFNIKCPVTDKYLDESSYVKDKPKKPLLKRKAMNTREGYVITQTSGSQEQEFMKFQIWHQ